MKALFLRIIPALIAGIALFWAGWLAQGQHTSRHLGSMHTMLSTAWGRLAADSSHSTDGLNRDIEFAREQWATLDFSSAQSARDDTEAFVAALRERHKYDSALNRPSHHTVDSRANASANGW